MLVKLLEFYRNSGVVICVGDLPIASDRVGRNDEELDNIVKEIFSSGQNGCVVSSKKDIISILDKFFTRDNYTATVKNPSEDCSEILISLKHLRGYYSGNAIPEPIKFTCGKGVIDIGDWSQYDGLYSYSGGIIYSKAIYLTKDQSKQRSVLDLGDVVSSAEVYVNGKFVAEKCAPTWEFDISNCTCEGENNIEVHVYNTLSNHYTTIPTNYRGSLKSGLIGPVSLRL